MSDTQWPRYEVFKQDRPGKRHESIGTVHAADPEMALQNGRDLFARRPRCHSMWVVPASAIFSRTAQELERDNQWRDTISGSSPPESYVVFQKLTERRGMGFTTHVGEVEASSPAEALALALNQFDTEHVFVWWVCPERAILASEDDDIDSMFSPALDKKYRLPNQYRTVFSMQKIRRDSEK